MDLTLLSLLLGAIALFVIYLVNRYSYWSKHGVPCAKGTIPLLGHMLPLLTFRSSMEGICSKMYEAFPNASMVGFYKLTRPVLLIREPELVKTVLQNNFTSFHENGSKVNPSMDPLLAKNPFFTYGDEWVLGRKRLSYAFSGLRLKILFESVKGVSKKFGDFVERKLKTSGKYEVELKYLCSKFTGEVVANAGFGIEGQCFEDEAKQSSSFQRIGKAIFEPGVWTAFAQSMIFFLPEFNKILKTQFIPQEVNDVFRTIVREVLKTRRHETVARNDFFHLMIELEKTEGGKLDEEVLAAHALSFFVDGYESSSITLSFVGYHVATHPDVQRKLREEIVSVLSKHNGTMTYESLKEMTYMDQVISESQRRYPALGLMIKRCTEEFELRGSDGLCIRVKPGTEIYIPTYALQRDPKYWVNSDTFDPERFSEDRKQDIEKFAYIPFGEGPRMCVGIRMAILQMKACLTTLVKNYSLELSPRTKLPIKLSPSYFLLQPIGGLWVYIKRL